MASKVLWTVKEANRLETHIEELRQTAMRLLDKRTEGGDNSLLSSAWVNVVDALSHLDAAKALLEEVPA